MKIVGIEFDNDEKIYYYYVENMDLRKNVTVIVNENGTLRFGKVVTPIHPIDEKKLTKALGDVIRIATKQDYQKYMANLKQANQALEKCKTTPSYCTELLEMDNYEFRKDYPYKL